MSHELDAKNYFFELQNTVAYHPGPVAPSTADTTSFMRFFARLNIWLQKIQEGRGKFYKNIFKWDMIRLIEAKSNKLLAAH